jgi:hypothetical protein
VRRLLAQADRLHRPRAQRPPRRERQREQCQERGDAEDRAELVGIRLKAWKTNPIRSRRRIVRRRSLSRSSSVSPSETLPGGGRSRPAATCRNVLLPELNAC